MTIKYTQQISVNMREIVFLTLFSCFYYASQAQSIKEKSAIGVSISGLGDNTSFHWTALAGGGDYSGRGYHSFGITYTRSLSNTFHLETGVEYSKNTYHFSNPSLGPGIDVSHNAYLSLIEIPISVRLNFWQYFFLNGGLLLDFDITKDKYLNNQTGIGAILGVGAKYDFKKIPIGLFVNPHLKYRPLTPFTKERYHLRTAESGFRIGVVYNY
ncbi:MAG TPA: hypothetical protein VEV16_03105 [Daejeonella sp.]|nr:hypothetical protein [Daejeonella sp.]